MILTRDGNKRLLHADEIECRVGNWNKDKTRYTVLLYKTARTDMDILDEIFGIDGWQVEYQTIGEKLFCNLGVFSEAKGYWIWKESNGAESNIEAEKGQASDALKRAGFMFGIGRELYSAPQIWLDKSVNSYDLKVEQIEYDASDKICTLVLSSKGEIVYQYRNGKGIAKTEDKPQPQPIGVDHDTLEQIRDIVDKLEFEGKNVQEILDYYHVKSIGEIPLFKWQKMLEKVRGI